MTTPDLPDWTSSVAFLDQASAYAIPSNQITPGGASVTLNTPAAFSIRVAVNPPASAAGKRYILGLKWLDAGSIVARDWLTFHSAASYSDTVTGLSWQLPALGSSVIIEAFGDDATVIPLFVTQSNRALIEENVARTSLSEGEMLLSTGSVLVNAGGVSAVFYCPPVARAVWVSLNTSAGMPGSVIILGAMIFNGFVDSQQITRPQLAGASTIQQLVQVPHTGLEVQLSNTDTVNRTMRCNIWDAS